MAKVVVIGAGFAGHTAALYLGDKLGRKHEVTVISNRDVFGYVPSWVWVGVGHMKPEKTVFKLKPVYDRKHIKFVHAAAKEVHPDAGDQYVQARRLAQANKFALIMIIWSWRRDHCSTLLERPASDRRMVSPIPFVPCHMQ